MESTRILSQCQVQFEELIQDYQTLAAVEPGQKLEVATDQIGRRYLQISSGENNSWMGWVTQVVQRQYSNLMRYAAADAESVLQYMEDQNTRCRESLAKLAECAIRSRDKETLQLAMLKVRSLQGVLKSSSKKAYHLADSYLNKPQFYERFRSMGVELERLHDREFSDAELALEVEIQELIVQENCRLLKTGDDYLRQHICGDDTLSFDLFTRCATLAQSFGWVAAEGQGPSFFGRLYSYGNTLVQKARSCLNLSHPADRFGDPVVRRSLWPLGVSGQELNGSILAAYLSLVSEERRLVDFLPQFLFGHFNRFTLQEVTAALHQWRESTKKNALDRPIVIPLCVQASNYWASNHVVVLIVSREFGVEYFDPRGVSAKNQLMQDRATLADVAAVCRDLFLPGSKRGLVENLLPHQFDCHNCGAYVMHYVFRRFEEGCSPVLAMAERVTPAVLEGFKVKLVDRLAPAISARQGAGAGEEQGMADGLWPLESESFVSSSEEASDGFR